MRQVTALLARIGHVYLSLPAASPVVHVRSSGVPFQARAGGTIRLDDNALNHRRPRGVRRPKYP